MRVGILGLVVASLVAASSAARAGDNESGGAAAESLFQDARKLMDAKKYSEACPKFLASERLSAALGTLMNLADCYEKNNQHASAWARFHEAIAFAQRMNRPDREKTARERADRLEGRLIKLTIISQAKNIDVKLDGNALDPTVLGAAIPVDPGKHTLEASAKDKKPFTTTLDVSERAKSPSVEIPPLEDAPHETTEPKTDPNKDPSGTKPDKDSGSTQRILGIAAGGVGVVGIGIGAFFGIQTSSKWSDAKQHCNGADCDRAGVDLATTAKNDGNLSTVAFIVGGLLVAGGAVLFFTAPTAETRGDVKPSVRVGVGPGSVIVGGRF